MCREQEPVSGRKIALTRFAGDEKARSARHEKHPLVIILIVPLPFRRRLAGRYDPLDAQPLAAIERLRELPGKRPRRESAAQVSGYDPHRLGRLDALSGDRELPPQRIC